MTATMVEAAARALLFAVVMGAGLRLLRVTNVPVRKAVWTLVLVASLGMPWLMRWTGSSVWAERYGWAVPVPAARVTLMAGSQAPAIAVTRAPEENMVPLAMQVKRAAAHPAASAAPPAVTQEDAAVVKTSPAPEPLPKSFQWPATSKTIAMMYLAVAGFLLVRLFWGLAMAIRLWLTAERVSPLTAPEPNVRASAKILSPVTLGSGIVLPADYREWDRGKLRMVLAHERSHVRQMDFYLQLLAGLYTALFWFSPLGWWLRRTLATLGEAIGDRAGLDAAGSRSGYAELLLEFAAMPRQALPGVAMARRGNLSHRIERMLNERLFHNAFAEGRRRAVFSLLLVPAVLFGATTLIRVARAQTAPPVPPKAPAPIAARVPVAPPANVLTPAPVDLGVPPVAPLALAGVVPEPPAHLPDDELAPQAPAPPPPPPAMAEGPGIAVGPGIAYNAAVRNYLDHPVGNYAFQYSNGGESWAIVDGPDTSVTFNGSWNEDHQAELEAARKMAKGPFLWFTHQGKSYVVTDPEILARVRAFYKPIDDLGHQQDALGKQQDELGRQMEELDRQQEGVQVKMPDLSKQMAEMDAALAKAKESRDQWNTKELAEAEASLKAAQDKMLTPEKMADLQEKLADAQAAWNDNMAQIQSQLAELQGKLGELQGEAGAKQGEVGAKMGALGEQQGKLGAEQGRLGAEQGRLAQQADQKVRGIIDQSLRDGKATLVPSGKE